VAEAGRCGVIIADGVHVVTTAAPLYAANTDPKLSAAKSPVVRWRARLVVNPTRRRTSGLRGRMPVSPALLLIRLGGALRPAPVAADNGQPQWERSLMADEHADRSAILAVYAEVSNNYRAIDELRLKLLALLPLATGTGIVVFLGRGGSAPGAGAPAHVAVPIGLFGMVATVSLYFYELHGVEKCAHFIQRGDLIERQLDVRGSFRNRPHHIFGVVSELLPTMIIYPASFATWLFVALSAMRQQWFGLDVRLLVTGAATLLAVVASVATVLVMERTRDARRARQEQFDDEQHLARQQAVERGTGETPIAQPGAVGVERIA
jgi:hypothetical protein